MKIIKTALLLVLVLVLVSGCSMTSSNTPAPVVVSNDIKRINPSCAEQAITRVSNISSSVGGYVGIAENAEACLANIALNVQHPDNHLGMQLQAIAVNSYFKAGDIVAAKAAFSDFKAKFPMQDLVYKDFTSFVDTTTALLQYKQLTSLQLERLNINPILKAELARQQRWILQ